MSIFSKLTDNISEYIDVRIRSVQLAIVEKTSFVLSYIIYVLILTLVGFAILFFLGFSLVEFFALLTGSHLYGVLLTVSAYLLLFFLVILLRKSIIRGFASIFVRVLTQKDNDDDDEKENN